MSTSTLPTWGIMTLPVELHDEILSHLPLHSQLSASMVCKLWCDIVLQNRALKQTRYPNFIVDGVIGLHRFLNVSDGLVCGVRNGVVDDYYLRLFNSCGNTRRPRILTLLKHHPLLDEPALSPFDSVESIKFSFHVLIGAHRHGRGMGPVEVVAARGDTVRGFIDRLASKANELVQCQYVKRWLKDMGFPAFEPSMRYKLTIFDNAQMNARRAGIQREVGVRSSVHIHVRYTRNIRKYAANLG